MDGTDCEVGGGGEVWLLEDDDLGWISHAMDNMIEVVVVVALKEDDTNDSDTRIPMRPIRLYVSIRYGLFVIVTIVGPFPLTTGLEGWKHPNHHLFRKWHQCPSICPFFSTKDRHNPTTNLLTHPTTPYPTSFGIIVGCLVSVVPTPRSPSKTTKRKAANKQKSWDRIMNYV